MAAAGMPVKPPRGVKTAKETSGVLMYVIQKLSSSASTHVRDSEKAKLLKEFTKTDEHLEKLVAEKETELNEVVQVFAKVSSQITEARQKIKSVKENLYECKALLHCKQDELKKLWLEGIQQKHVLQLLEQVEQLKSMPVQISLLVEKKSYLKASKLLVTSLGQLEHTLRGVEALKEVTHELQSKKEQLHVALVAELTRLIYHEAPNEAHLNLKRQGSGRGSEALTPLQRQGSERLGHGSRRTPTPNTKAKRTLALEIPGVRGEPDGAPGPGTTDHKLDEVDWSRVDPDNVDLYIAVLVECLALLRKMPETVDTLKTQMQKEMQSMAMRSAQFLQQELHAAGQQDTNQSKPLLDLLQMLFSQFRIVVMAHTNLIRSMRRAAGKHGVKCSLYDVADVWHKVQAVLQLLLTEYLDITNLGADPEQAPSALYATPTNISSYFARRRPPRPKKLSLFKFGLSSVAVSAETLAREQKSSNSGSGRFNPLPEKSALVVKPTASHVTLIFSPLTAFMEEIEQELGLAAGTHCSLHTYIHNFIKDEYLSEVHTDIANRIEQATKAADAWKSTTSPEMSRQLGTNVSVLQSTVSVMFCMEELRGLMGSLPHYTEHFLSMMCNTLLAYKETCLAAYGGVIQPDAEDRCIFSAAWVKDNDICRLFKSLPNWKGMHMRRAVISEERESEEEVNRRNIQETRILTENLRDSTFPLHEIISDASQFRLLAKLQESMEWLAVYMMELGNSLVRSPGQSPKTQATSAYLPAMPEAFIQTLEQLASDFEELSDICVLVLHMEVRVRCFYHLLPMSKESSFNLTEEAQEPDVQVSRLNKDLIGIHEVLLASLQPRKVKYIFEGLGHLMAAILIGTAQFMTSINEPGIKKMCRNIFSLEQTLTGITMNRESALNHARDYFELFYMTPDEILNGIMERGAQYAEMDYFNALHLIHRSQSGTLKQQISLQSHLHRLSAILGETGVTV